MDALLNYGSGSEGDSGDERRKSGEGASPSRSAGGGGSSTDSGSSESSLDSAAKRAAAAAARLRDFGEASSGKAKAKGGGAAGGKAPAAAAGGGLPLPSALDALTGVARPEFLDPEAIRQIPVAAHHGRAAKEAAAAAAAAAAASAAGGGGGGRGKTLANAGPDADISRLAPKLKGQQQADKRGPPGAVIEGRAKRYKDDGPEATQQYTAAQIAMLGGKLAASDAAAAAAGGPGAVKGAQGPPAPGGAGRDRGKPTGALPVSEFLDKGLGGAQLPRKAQDRKERERAKRSKGQSTHAEWKPEAWMVLRQQYDG